MWNLMEGSRGRTTLPEMAAPRRTVMTTSPAPGATPPTLVRRIGGGPAEDRAASATTS